MNDLKQLIKNIEQWAEERNLIKGSTPQKKMLKLMEEFGELCGGVSKNKVDVVKDSIGDCFVVMVILNKQTNSKFDFVPLPLHGYRGTEVWVEKCVGKLASISEKINYKGNAKRYLEYDFGYLLFALMMIASECHLSLHECVQSAWEEIKDRKGKMIDGVFVKEDDLRPVGRSKLLGASYGNK